MRWWVILKLTQLLTTSNETEIEFLFEIGIQFLFETEIEFLFETEMEFSFKLKCIFYLN